MLVLVGIVSLGAMIAKWIFDWDYQLKSEYVTADVIRDVEQFVKLQNGRWPRSWDELPGAVDARNYARIDFNASTQDLIADRHRIYTAITPMSREYRTYPHAERQLDQLRDTLVRFHTENLK
jgi:hypothetical protein